MHTVIIIDHDDAFSNCTEFILKYLYSRFYPLKQVVNYKMFSGSRTGVSLVDLTPARGVMCAKLGHVSKFLDLR